MFMPGGEPLGDSPQAVRRLSGDHNEQSTHEEHLSPQGITPV
jgi:hypothetical protein